MLASQALQNMWVILKFSQDIHRPCNTPPEHLENKNFTYVVKKGERGAYTGFITLLVMFLAEIYTFLISKQMLKFWKCEVTSKIKCYVLFSTF